MTSAQPTGAAVRRRVVTLAVVLVSLVLRAGWAGAQELEPRAYSASPVGAGFLVIGLTRSTGGIVADPTLPITDIEAAINGLPVSAGYTFGLFGKLALVTTTVPYAWGDVSGQVFEQGRTVSRSGLTDVRAKLSVNLRGNPAMGLREFVASPRRTILGTSLTVTSPTGQFDGSKLINLGTNRWGFKPEVGISVPKGPWDLDAYVGVWLFTDNDNFFPGGVRRSQEPVVAVQGHASYTFRPRLWAAFDATWYQGGAAAVSGGPPVGAMNNSRLGGTVSVPVGRRQSIKCAYSSGVEVRTGTNFQTISIGWQYLFFTKM